MSEVENRNTSKRQSVRTVVLPYAVLAVSAVLVYCMSLPYPFLGWDDTRFITDNPLMAPTADNVLFFALHPFSDLYTPMAFYSFMVDAAVFGLNPFGFRLVNLLIQTTAACILYAVLRRLGIRRSFALLAALLWEMSPQRVESTAWISERKDVLCGLFAFASMYSFQRLLTANGRRTVYWSVAAGMLAVLAIFSKPAAAALPGVFLVYAFGVTKPGGKYPGGRVLFPAAAALAANIWAGMAASQTIPASLETNLLVPLHNLFWYPLMALFPYTLNPIYPAVRFDSPGDFLMIAASAALAASMIAGAVRLGVPRRKIICGVLIALGSLVPVLGLMRYTAFHYCDRYNYLASVPVLASAAYLLDRMSVRLPNVKRAVLALLTLYAVLLAGRSMLYLPEWSGTSHLFRYAFDRSALPNGKLLAIMFDHENPEFNPIVHKLFSDYRAEYEHDLGMPLGPTLLFLEADEALIRNDNAAARLAFAEMDRQLRASGGRRVFFWEFAAPMYEDRMILAFRDGDMESAGFWLNKLIPALPPNSDRRRAAEAKRAAMEEEKQASDFDAAPETEALP